MSQCFAVEWYVCGKFAHLGRGDLVFHLGAHTDLVVETKFIPLHRTGRTARTKRNMRRAEVKAQALRYGNHWRCRPDAAAVVWAASFTNERGLQLHMVLDRTKEHAAAGCHAVHAASHAAAAVVETGPSNAVISCRGVHLSCSDEDCLQGGQH